MLTKSDLQAIKGLLKPLEHDITDVKSRVINLESDMKVVRSDIKLLHKKSDKFMAKTNALEQSPNFAILHPN